MRLFTAAAFAALGLSLATPSAFALDDAEKKAVREEVRALLMEEPELIIEAFKAYELKQREEAAKLEQKIISDNAEAIYYDTHSHVRGNLKGDLTLVEFMDYRCGFCKRAHAKVLDIVKKDGNIRYVVKEFPILGPDSTVAAKAAVAAVKQENGDKLTAFQDMMMESKAPLDEKLIMELAVKAGFDADKLKKDMEAPGVDEAIKLNYALAKALDINGTPAFLIGKTLMRGDMPADEILAAIKQAREKKEPGVKTAE